MVSNPFIGITELYALIEAVRTLSSNGWVQNTTSDSDIKNMLISEVVKETNYQDFKEMYDYFFK